ncbi:glycosyltransferase [Candidatus Poribacteria bacterium]|jgi:spore maturation protein CgeB|nr:glycosyltransferase [Candidatus Poribacteria bacterium]MBT5532811.1 glycosyltransferase [Candidatus Poribacteria bacterium]MBT5714522.1 glycosyltransferase [Candidatus Poribacteria bacterium]MBT7101617.1 glycosyltransferase [Candidatus Poribacteria bacterium]
MSGIGAPPAAATAAPPTVSLRILYAALAYDYGDVERGRSFEHWNFYDSLRRMGHDVIYFDYPSLMAKLGKRSMNLALWDVVTKERPDLLLFVPFNDEVNPRVLERITKETSTVTAAWFCDDHWRFDGVTKLYAPCVDWSVTTADSALPKYAALGYDRVIKSQWGCNHWLYTPSVHPPEYDVSFIGMAHGNRPQVIERMVEAGLSMAVRGTGWPGGRLPQATAIEVMSRSRICLNLSNASTPDQEGLAQQIKGRHFEIPACGAMQLTDAVAGLDEYFADGEEVVVASSVDDLFAKARHYLANPAERDAIAQAGRSRALAEHTYERRFSDIFARIHASDPKAVGWGGTPRRVGPVRDIRLASHRVMLGYPQTSIIILNHNGREHIENCLDSITSLTDTPYELIVIDNGSKDGSVEYLREIDIDCMTLIENPVNLGCPPARAQAMSLARGEYLLFLDNDTIVTAGWLRRLIEHCEDNPGIGVIGPSTNFAGGPQRLADTPYTDTDGLFAFAEELSQKERGSVTVFGRLIGFCMLIRRSVVDRVGNCDGRFGTYGFEDDDYCWRAVLAGYQVCIAKDVFVHHVGNQGSAKGAEDYVKIIPTAWLEFRDKWELPETLDMQEYFLLISKYRLMRAFDRDRDYIELPDPAAVAHLTTRTPSA